MTRASGRAGKGAAPKRPVRTMFSLVPVEFRDSAVAGRGVFARRRFRPGEVVVAYAPKQRKLDARDPAAIEAAESKVTLLSGRDVIIPDTTVPGGWQTVSLSSSDLGSTAGFSVALPPGYELQIRPRSGLAFFSCSTGQQPRPGEWCGGRT